MKPEDGRLEHICPVCGRGLGSSPDLRRCPHCGARALWRSGRTALDLSLVLFNARLCGIMAGIQAGLIALVAGGYRMPVPTWLVAVTALLPVAGYVIAGFVAARIAPGHRRGYLVLVVALNLGLLLALIAAELGLSEPVSLLALASLGTVASSPLVSRGVRTWIEEEESRRHIP